MMTRARSLIVLAIALVLGVAYIAETQAQERERSGRGFGRGSSRSSLLGLLSLEQVQKEMKLSEEQTTKVQWRSSKSSGPRCKSNIRPCGRSRTATSGGQRRLNCATNPTRRSASSLAT